MDEEGLDESVELARANFGISDVLSSKQAAWLETALNDVWTSLYGPPRKLRDDLKRTRTFFDPVATGGRLRSALGNLNDAGSPGVDIPPELAIRLPGGAALITPEGRCVLELLSNAERSAGAVFLRPGDIRRCELELLQLYRKWSRHRIDQVVALMGGNDKPLQLPAAGVILLLLINRSTSPERAIQRRSDSPAREQIDAAFFGPVYAFADSFGHSERRDPKKEGLIKGWTIGEVRRRFPNLIHFDPKRVFVPEQQISEVEHRLAAELCRRRDVDVLGISDAFGALVGAYRKGVGTFASYGMAHERPRDTEALRRRLLDAFTSARAEG